MRIFVTGAAGQMGYDVINELHSRGHFVIGVDIRPLDSVSRKPNWDEYIRLDITDKEQVAKMVDDVKPDAIVHCAAWTNVGDADDPKNKPLVKKVNVDGTDNLVKAAKEVDAKFVYISTDYVFSGDGDLPWEPDEKDFAPQNYYAETKLQGEMAVSSQLEKYFIVRIAWVFGLNGKNLVKAMYDAGKTNKVVKAVYDRVGAPTYTYDLARLLADMVETDKYGYYHAANEGGYASWYVLTCEIYKMAGLDVRVIPVSSEEYGSFPIKYPSNSRLDTRKLTKMGFKPLPDWRDALSRYLECIKRD